MLKCILLGMAGSICHPVGCEEHDRLVGLQGSQEHTDEGITVDVAN